MNTRHLCAASTLAIAMGLGATHASAAAAAAAAAPGGNEVSEVVVTGSFIAGTPKNTAIPVAVLNQEEIEKRGTPNMIEEIWRLA